MWEFTSEKERYGDEYKFCYYCNYNYGDDECHNCNYYDVEDDD